MSRHRRLRQQYRRQLLAKHGLPDNTLSQDVLAKVVELQAQSGVLRVEVVHSEACANKLRAGEAQCSCHSVVSITERSEPMLAEAAKSEHWYEAVPL